MRTAMTLTHRPITLTDQMAMTLTERPLVTLYPEGGERGKADAGTTRCGGEKAATSENGTSENGLYVS